MGQKKRYGPPNHWESTNINIINDQVDIDVNRIYTES